MRHAQAGGLRAHLAQRWHERLAIRIVQEHRLAPVAALHDAGRAGASQRKRMVDRATILDSQLASHDGRVARAASCFNIKTPFLARDIGEIIRLPVVVGAVAVPIDIPRGQARAGRVF